MGSWRRAAGTAVCCSVLAGWSSASAAKDLSEQVATLFGGVGIEGVVTNTAVPHNFHFGSESFKQFSLLMERFAATAADFPAISTVPGITYRYDPKLQVFEPASESLGPVFVERPRTLGRGKLDVGFSYLFVDFDELDGQDLDELSFRGLKHNDCCAAPPSPDQPGFEEDTADVFFEKFTLQSHVMTFLATYGVTDDWDVNVLLPIVYTKLDVRARAVLNKLSDGTQPTHTFGSGSNAEVVSVSDDKVGLGDVQIRTKRHLLALHDFHLAGGLALRVESGKEADFQGIGETTLTPFVAVSQEFGRLDLHASSGIEVVFFKSDRSRVRYAAGATVEVLKQLALLVDVIGSSNLQSERLTVEVPQFLNKAVNGQVVEVPNGTARFSQEVSTDIVDVAGGVKVALSDRAVAFAQVFVPINDDGLRAKFIPAAGVEMSF